MDDLATECGALFEATPLRANDDETSTPLGVYTNPLKESPIPGYQSR